MALGSLEKRVLENEEKNKKAAKAGKLPQSLLLQGPTGIYAYFASVLVIAFIFRYLVAMIWMPVTFETALLESVIFAVIFTIIGYLMINRKN